MASTEYRLLAILAFSGPLAAWFSNLNANSCQLSSSPSVICWTSATASRIENAVDWCRCHASCSLVFPLVITRICPYPVTSTRQFMLTTDSAI
eukprot:3707026-Amphidinium_carterae.1